jgi:hypothetical protein
LSRAKRLLIRTQLICQIKAPASKGRHARGIAVGEIPIETPFQIARKSFGDAHVHLSDDRASPKLGGDQRAAHGSLGDVGYVLLCRRYDVSSFSGGARVAGQVAARALDDASPPRVITLDLGAPGGRKSAAGPDWIHEIKYDDYRMLLLRGPERVRFISRGGHDWGRTISGKRSAAPRPPQESLVLDGGWSSLKGTASRTLTRRPRASITRGRGFIPSLPAQARARLAHAQGVMNG